MFLLFFGLQSSIYRRMHMHIRYIWVMFRADRYSSFTIAVHLLAALQSLILSPIPMCNSSAHNPLAGLLYVDTGMYLYMHFPGYDNFFILSLPLSLSCT